MDSATAKKPKIAKRPPQSISNIWTVLATLLGVAAGCAITFWWRPDADIRLTAMILMACVFIPVALVEMLLNNAPEQAGLTFAWRPMSYVRIARKLGALWAIFALLASAYAAFPLYAGKTYEDFQWLLGNFGWLLVIVSIPYVAVVDTFQIEPEDGLASWGRILFSLSFDPTPRDFNYLLGWLVKGFFLPLMFSFLVNNISTLRQIHYGDYASFASYLYDLSYNGLYFIDVVVGAVGYASTLRLLGTEIRSTEPTLLGWTVALVCYPPFWGAVGDNYLAYGHDRPWGALLGGWPILYIIWGTVIVCLICIYVWATVVFGIRFSNLTHRGIITSGPYRWTKHPAYLAKNATWWLISVPFLPPDGSILTAIKLSLMLAGVNLIYYLRARTEERHLSRDPVYRDYAEFIRQQGLFSIFRR